MNKVTLTTIIVVILNNKKMQSYTVKTDDCSRLIKRKKFNILSVVLLSLIEFNTLILHAVSDCGFEVVLS